MPFNILEMVKNYFTSEFNSHASSALGEDSSAISKALSALIPTELAGILNKATSGTAGANDVFEMAKTSTENVSASTNLTSTENIEKGRGMLSNLFGSSRSEIIGTVSRFSGIKDSSADSLMSMSLPAVMGLLGKHAEQNNLSSSGLAGFLSSQKDHIMQALPSGLTAVAGMFGFNSIGSTATAVPSDVKSHDLKSPVDDVHTISETPTAKWLVPLIVILVILALLWSFSRSCNQTKPTPSTDIDSTAMIQNTNQNLFLFLNTNQHNAFELRV